MITYKTGRDANGNKVCRVKVPNHRGFSIQTLQNLALTHVDGVGPWTQGEVSAYVRDYGTKRQREALGIN